MGKQRASGDLIQDLRATRPHPGPLPGRKHDRQTAAVSHRSTPFHRPVECVERIGFVYEQNRLGSHRLLSFASQAQDPTSKFCKMNPTGQIAINTKPWRPFPELIFEESFVL